MAITLEGRPVGTSSFKAFHTSLGSTLRTKVRTQKRLIIPGGSLVSLADSKEESSRLPIIITIDMHSTFNERRVRVGVRGRVSICIDQGIFKHIAMNT